MPCRKMPEQESDHLTPATRLLEKRREMAEVEQALSTQKEVRRGLYLVNLSLQLAHVQVDVTSILLRVFLLS